MSSRFWQWLRFGFVMLVAMKGSAQTNGIFADFTTSMGTFTCQLDYTNSPKAVANFVGLATGEHAWLDLVRGEARTNAFYDGLTFHRVIDGFMDQGGSPNGQGTDGPGYAFVDEFSSSLTFNSSWVLAMANSGPDSNGSQFFVTVAPYVSGNNKYDIFGHVVLGTNVVAAINHVATDLNGKPLTNVVMQQVAIRREGAAAQAFDINAHGLPIVTNIPLKVAQSNGQVSLTFSNRLYANNRWYSTTDLSSWAGTDLGIETSSPTSNIVRVAMDSPQRFFRLAQIQYASSTFAPKNLFGGTLTMTFTAGAAGTITIVFDSSGGGTYGFPGIGSGTVTSYSWSQAPYHGLLGPIQFSGVPEMTFLLQFSASTKGSFTGTVYNGAPIPVAGIFTLTGL